jgi:hypothetical protein
VLFEIQKIATTYVNLPLMINKNTQGLVRAKDTPMVVGNLFTKSRRR